MLATLCPTVECGSWNTAIARYTTYTLGREVCYKQITYGVNPDHARNSMSNCGMRQLEYGDRKIHYVHTRKRGML